MENGDLGRIMTAEEILALQTDLPALHLNEGGNRPPRGEGYADLRLRLKPHNQLVPPPALTPEEEVALEKQIGELFGGE